MRLRGVVWVFWTVWVSSLSWTLVGVRAGAADRLGQERCYQSALAQRPEAAARLDWERTPAAEKLELLEAALAEKPDCAYLHYLRGVVLDAEMGSAEAAREAFERAVRLVPNFDLAHENIAIIHRATAHRSFRRAGLRPAASGDVFHLTRALAALKRAAEAVGGNPLWGPQRQRHLRGLVRDVEGELTELKSPEGNDEFLDGELKTMVVSGWRANVRTGFGLSFPRVTTLERGARVAAAAGHSRYGWIKVRLSDGRVGWIYHDLLRGGPGGD